MILAQRKLIELRQKLDSLGREFTHWRDESKEYQPLQKHHTQIRRITFQLEGMQAAILDELNEISKGDGDGVLAKARELELDILEVHRIWEFFRSKLVLRSVSWFNPYLVAADEFAWACYSSAQESFKYDKLSKDDLKEPPLVFFNGGSSPYTFPRNLTYEAEQVPGEELNSLASSSVLKDLPIPVIGIPWFQIQHLPEALVIGHEVGHDVEEDFQLTDRVASLVDNAMEQAKVPEDHRPAWRAWLREIFADVYGNLATGPAFVHSLMDFLATDKELTEKDLRKAPSWGNYPPDVLRMLVNVAVLNEQEFADQSQDLEKELRTNYPSHAMQSYESDIQPIVKAIVHGRYPEFKEKSLKDVIWFTPSYHQQALKDSKLLLNGQSPTTKNIRVLMAASRLAYGSDSSEYESKKVHNLVINRVPNIQAAGVRGTRGEQSKSNDSIERDNHDKNAGQMLFKRLKQLAK